MVNLKKTRIVGEIPVIDQGKVVAKATLEKLSGGRKPMAHIDMTGMTADILLRGFSFGVSINKGANNKCGE